MSELFASADLTAGQLNAIVKKLGGYEAALRFLRGELTVSALGRRWREEGGVIYFSVTSDGTTGEDWITRLESKGLRVGDYAKRVLRSPDFKPTSGVTTEVALLKGMLFDDQSRITKKIHAEADERKLEKPNAEAACLIREMFSDEEIEAMGLWWIVAMHEPIDSDGGPNLLGANRNDDGRWLNAYYDKPDNRWNRNDGFALALPQLPSFLPRLFGEGVLFSQYDTCAFLCLEC